jgi:ATP phosphoribosyltransferase
MVHTTSDDTLVLGIPKGSLQESTLDLFSRAGYHISVSSRSYFPTVDDDQMSAIMFRAQEMSRYVEDGIVDLGLTGYDWIRENDSDVVEICELTYSKATSRPARWVLAVPEEGPVQSVEDLDGGVVATELMNCTKRYFQEKGLNVKVEFSWGATEVKARLLDGIVDVTETGSSLRANKLRVIDEILCSTTRLIANKHAMEIDWKREKIENLAMLLQGAIAAKSKSMLKMNVQKSNLDAILDVLPSAKSPTISHLAEEDWVAVEVIIDESVERDLVPQLKRAGASAILTYPLHKVIP